jgi:hypothetical protein
MKTKWILPVLILCCCFASCFDITETITVHKDGSGVYEQVLDFSQLMKMLSGIVPNEDSAKRKEKSDTAFSLQSNVDTASNLTPEQKQVMRKGFIKIHIDEENNEWVMNMNFPFAGDEEFNVLQEMLSSEIFLSIVNPAAQNMPATRDGQNKLPLRQYKYSMTKTSITQEVVADNNQSIDTTETDEMKMLENIIPAHFSTIIRLPAPAKSWKGEDIIVSDDKQTLKLSKDAKLDNKSNPAMTFSIQY